MCESSHDVCFFLFAIGRRDRPAYRARALILVCLRRFSHGAIAALVKASAIRSGYSDRKSQQITRDKIPGKARCVSLKTYNSYVIQGKQKNTKYTKSTKDIGQPIVPPPCD